VVVFLLDFKMPTTRALIIKLLDIGNDFVFLDRIDANSGYWDLSNSGFYFDNHFNSNPILPASIIQESMLQYCVIFAYKSSLIDKDQKAIIYHTNMRIYKSVKPTACSLQLKVIEYSIKRNVYYASIVANTDDILVAKGLFKFFIQN